MKILELKSKITENTVDRIKNRMVKTEEKSISEFGDRTTKIIQFEKQRANRLGKK